jgi:hypothetical protein
MLVEQEYRHAQMHHEGVEQHLENKNTFKRWTWLLNLMLNRLGEKIGATGCGYFETCSYTSMYYPLTSKYTKGCLNNIAVFHALEELEHGHLTVQELRKKTNVINPSLFFLFS